MGETTITRQALEQLARINIRRRRSEHLAAAILDEIRDVVSDDAELDAIHQRLVKVLHDNGVAWTTDEERALLGLEPRDELGWTPSEALKAKQDAMEAMLSMARLTLPPDSTVW